MENFFSCFLLFFIYSAIGWCMESIYVSIQSNKFINRGFLIGPYCPIYGFGGLIITLYLTQYMNNLFTVFFLSIVVCSVLEYFTSYIMEKIFKARWWDYSDKKYNLNGRICGENAIAFGIISICVLYFINPFIYKLLDMIPNTVVMVLTIIFFVIFVTDTIISFNIISKLRKTATDMGNGTKDVTVGISKKVKQTVEGTLSLWQRRLIKAFPNSTFSKIINGKKKSRIKDILNNTGIIKIIKK